MIMLDWRWVNVGLPTSVDLKQEARSLLNSAYVNGYCATGGLVARYEDGEFSLEFVLEDSDSFDGMVQDVDKVDKVAKPLFKSSILSLSLQE
jgi:hypothetical protein